jgi:hypothetical protein
MSTDAKRRSKLIDSVNHSTRGSVECWNRPPHAFDVKCHSPKGFRREISY